MADPTIEVAAERPPRGTQEPAQQGIMSASGRMLPLTRHEDLATAQGRLQNEYAAIQRRAQELMSTMDIPGGPQLPASIGFSRWVRAVEFPFCSSDLPREFAHCASGEVPVMLCKSRHPLLAIHHISF